MDGSLGHQVYGGHNMGGWMPQRMPQSMTEHHQPHNMMHQHHQINQIYCDIDQTPKHLEPIIEHNRQSYEARRPSQTPPDPYQALEDNSRDSSKSHSTPMTLKWLNDNYEIAEGVCIPRSTLYQHYLDFCDHHEIMPVNAASFGKIIRQQFPQITTRRLGTRGQSKYHYYGIGVKEQSQYYDFVYSKAGLQSVNTSKKDINKQVVAPYTPRSKMGTLLPDFPEVESLQLPDDIDSEKVLTFVMMYRTHCQRILDTVIRANFDEVQNFLLHFWQGMPPHMINIVGVGPIVGMVAVCDTILYKAICNVLMPHVLQPLPESLTQVIKKFAKQLGDWISAALQDLPEPLRSMKLDMATKFSKILRLQMSLNHLCQASRTVINSSEIMGQMCEDWQSINRHGIIQQTKYTLTTVEMVEDLDRITEFYNEFETLLQEQAAIESFIEWLDRIINEGVVQAARAEKGGIRRRSRSFLLVWSAFSTRIIRDMTLHSAPSFGSYHLLHMVFDDYILYHLEQLCVSESSDEILAEIEGATQKPDAVGEEVLPDSSQVNYEGLPSKPNNKELLSPNQNHTDNTLADGPSNVAIPALPTSLIMRSSGEHSGVVTPESESSISVQPLNLDTRSSLTPKPTDLSSRHIQTSEGYDFPASSMACQPAQPNASVEQTWRLQDSIPPPPLTYHGEYGNLNGQTGEEQNPLYYAMNTLHCADPSQQHMHPADQSRVTYDPAEVQAALARSFQAYTTDSYYAQPGTPHHPKAGDKRSMNEPQDMQMNKHFHSNGQHYETEGYAMS